jgi:phosphoribosylamine-glycine ligase
MQKVYSRVKQIIAPDIQYRTDIGKRVPVDLERVTSYLDAI